MTLSALTLLQRLLSRGKLRHMQALIALNDLRSMGRAAQAMGMTQPAMSQLVAELEQLIETRLFIRHSKGVDPTAAALDLLPVARRMLIAAEEGAERIATRIHREGGVARIASTSAASGALLTRILPRFAREHPNIQVQVSGVIGQSLDASFAEDEFDVVCCRRRTVVPDGWTFRACVSDELVAVCGSQHPLAGKQTVTRSELARATWLQNHVSTTARHRFDELVAREGWGEVAEVQILSTVPVLLWSMLRDGALISFVPRSVVEPWLAEGSLKELPANLGTPLPPIGYHWKPDEAGSATKLVAEMLSSVGDIGG